MAISLSFGILFATVITLFLVPALYLLPGDIRRGARAFGNFMLGRETKRATRSEAGGSS
jgi:hypothetical protein